jgi:hypothetical protein
MKAKKISEAVTGYLNYEDWEGKVYDHVRAEAELDHEGAEVFMTIADDELSELYDNNVAPMEAALTIIANEDFWEEFHSSYEEEFGEKY